jgi:DNA-binding HxlR family transcriptional regulator
LVAVVASLEGVKRYGQRCPVARALDVVGDRWTPLIMRELLLGPKRYTDLSEALPGIGTNILASRLNELQSHGIVTKRTLAPPTPVAVYELTEAGEAFAPVIDELRVWGQQFAPKPKANDAVRPAWVIQSAAASGSELKPGTVGELRVGDETFEVTAGDGRAVVKSRPAQAPDAVLSLEPSVLMGLAAGRLDPVKARDRIAVQGDPRVAGELVEMLAGAVR